ncbi:SusC/RagA family TonB-linked outer membrane protein [Cyclobacterium sp. SYSU L10401]|uniref:SusC/RagA family TonB-linked outer membrane protein n=1 Tax=Cyclobacterium sp. SYSU L10401 TaxID=2678657 RepID=UPI0013D6A470|nr:TonB-dependent receptor [Cyclobacterium sp. SYSU L10401]
MKKILPSLFVLVLMVVATSSMAQSITVSGTVFDENESPLPGVSILIKNSSSGTVTDLDGRYQIEVPSSNSVLVYSFLGYFKQEITVGNQRSIDVNLDPDMSDLSEVVVVGYGDQRRINLTGSVESIDGAAISRQPVFQASQALVGMTPGLTAIQSSSRPGADGATLRVRGIGSLGASNDPLVLVDGIQGDINNIDPADIESISVLKDAAASAIYGSRGSNGVILVTTKRGKVGAMTVSYNTYAGWQEPQTLPSYLGAIDFLRVTNTDEAAIANYEQNMATNPDIYPDTDWMDLLFSENGFQQYHNLTVNGGTENVQLMGSISYTDQGANVKNYNFKRYNGRFNSDIKINDKFDLTFDLNFSQELTSQPNSGLDRVFLDAFRIDPTQVAIHTDGSWGDGWSGQNPIAHATDGGLNRNENNYFRGLMRVNYSPVKDLNVSLTYSPEYRDLFDRNFNKMYTTILDWDSKSTRNVPDRNSLSNTNTRIFENNLIGLITYSKSITDHQFTILGGYEMIKTNWMQFGASRTDFIIDRFEQLNAGAETNMRNNGSATHSSLVSYFSRFNYSYLDKYLFEANVRRDASSRFAPENRVSIFPSFSAGWRLTEEAFFSPLDFFSEFKLRASWGRLGNQQIGSQNIRTIGNDFPYTANILLGASNFIFGDNVATGAAQNVLANRGIRWESAETANIGLDAGLINNQLTFSVEYYVRTTNDILLALPVPRVVGLSAPLQNVGSVENRGVDFNINWRDAIGQFNYSANFNFSDVKNEVTNLGGLGQIISGNSITTTGSPIGSIFGYQSMGYFQNQEEIDNAPNQFGGLIPGNIRYVDQPTLDTNGDGMNDSSDEVINPDDRVIIGDPFPRYSYALNLTADYKGFDFALMFQGVGKRDLLLQGDAIMPLWNAGKVQEWHVEESWTPERQNARIPVLAPTSSGSNDARASDVWVFDASYLAIRNLSLGYNFPTLKDRLKARSLRVYTSIQNLANFNRLPKGTNPLTPNGSSGAFFPIARAYTFGASLTF